MITYGKRSRTVLAELHPALREIWAAYAVEAPADLDVTLIDGYRGEAAQNAALASGASTKAWGESKHNVFPSRATDFDVYPELPHDAPALDIGIAFAKRIGLLQTIAARKGIKIKVGIDWRKPFDPGHVELA
jgi:hypothetical protein